MGVAFTASFAVVALGSLFHRESGNVNYRLKITSRSLFSMEKILIYGITKIHFLFTVGLKIKCSVNSECCK